MHARGTVHGDIKLNNCLVSGDYKGVVLGDFGIAQRVDGTSPYHRDRIYSPNKYWIAPEAGTVRAGWWTDVFALAKALVQLLTGTVVPYVRIHCRGFLIVSVL